MTINDRFAISAATLMLVFFLIIRRSEARRALMTGAAIVCFIALMLSFVRDGNPLVRLYVWLWQ